MTLTVGPLGGRWPCECLCVCVFSVNAADRWWVLADFSMSSRSEAGRVCPLQSQQLSNRLCSLWLPPCLTSHTALQLSNWIWSVVRRNRLVVTICHLYKPKSLSFRFSPQIWFYTNDIFENAGIPTPEIQYTTVGTGAIEIVAGLIGVSFHIPPMLSQSWMRKLSVSIIDSGKRLSDRVI